MPHQSHSPAHPAICVREATDADGEFVARLAREADMGELTPRGTTFVAWGCAADRRDEGGRLGFIRIVEAEGAAYVNPIVIDETARGRGVGEALITFARQRFGTLRLVARGSALPFYERLGATPIGWNDIAADIAADCDGCPERNACAPVPMRI